MGKKRFMVVGLGILGETVARTLAAEGAEVIALDMDPIYVERIKDTTAMAVQGDSTDSKLLTQLGVQKMDAVIVCIGENFPGALLTTMQLLDLKVKHVAVRATSKLHADLFKRLGAHDVFFVESEMGKAIAHRVSTPGILHEMDLGEGLRIVESHARPWMIGKNIADLALPKNYAVQIIAIRDSRVSSALVMPRADLEIKESFSLLLVGRDRDLARLMDD
jgi:trk system potassium uptake protein TrkA